jgi:hypothetical protein
VQRYEQLRGAAVDGQPAGSLGLALLRARGVAGWMRAWPGCTPVPSKPGTLALPSGGAQDIVGVLAEMALAVAAGS